MKIAMVINGTRGDVQPMIALANGLMKKGHDVIMCATPENEDLARQNQCPFIPFGPNYRELFRKKAKKMKGGATLSPSPKQIKKDTAEQMNLLPDLIKGSDLVLGVGFVLGVHTVADVMKIPYRFVVFYPAMLGPTHKDPAVYRMLFGFGKSMTNMMMKSFVNKVRAKAGLEAVKDVWDHWMGDEVLVASDKEINEAREGVEFKFIQTAYMPLPSKMKLPKDVEKFLDDGKPPVFIGFGSNPIARPEEYFTMFSHVLEATNQRLIISKGWADLPETKEKDILYVEEMPYEYLFPRLAAVIHHGGTGTMAVAARAGIPQAAFPFMADQFENRKQITRLGIGPDTTDFKKMTAEDITNAIRACVTDVRFKENAVSLAEKLKGVNGVDMTVKVVESVAL